jgi:hypothetical protein
MSERTVAAVVGLADWPEVLEAILGRLVFYSDSAEYEIDDQAVLAVAVRRGHAILTQLRVERASRLEASDG